MIKKIFGLLLISVISFGALAQEDEADDSSGGKYGATPEDSVACITSLSLYKEYYKQKRYTDALPGWRKAVTVCPASRKSLYLDGSKMYKQLIKENKDNKELVKAYVDTLMWVYDTRIEHFGQEGYVLGRKGGDLMKYRKNDPKQAYDALKKSFELTGNKFEAGAVVAYYQSVYYMNKKGLVEKGEMLELFPVLSEVCENNIANGSEKDKERYGTALENLEKLFSTVASCEDLVEIFTPKFQANPEDESTLNSIVKVFGKRDCTDEQLYIDAAIALHKKSPSYESANAIGKKLAVQSKCGEAIDYFKQAAELAATDEDKVDANMSAAKCYYNIKQYSNVRSSCNAALAVNPNYGAAHILIGDIYSITAKQCGDDACKSKAAYWAAYDRYLRAKSVDASVAEEANKKAAGAKAQFPKQADCFFYGLSDGASYQLDCWIGETTTVRVQ